MIVTHTLMLDAYKSGAQYSFPISTSDFYSHRFLMGFRAGGEPIRLSDTDEAVVVCEGEEICESATVHSISDKEYPNTVEYFLSALPKKTGSYNYSVKIFSREVPSAVYCAPSFELVVRIAGKDGEIVGSEPYSAVVSAKVEAESFAENARASAERAQTVEQVVTAAQKGIRNIFTSKARVVEEATGTGVRYYSNMADIVGSNIYVKIKPNDMLVDTEGQVYSITSVDTENGRGYLERLDLSLKGPKGDVGRGIQSERVEQSEVSGGINEMTLTFTDGTQKKIYFYNGVKGDKGERGDPFKIKKTYPSVEAMNSDLSNTDIVEGDIVAICTGDVEDSDNAKVYTRTDSGFEFLLDMSGAKGIKGSDGHTPIKGVDYFTAAEKREMVSLVLESLPIAEEVVL